MKVLLAVLQSSPCLWHRLLAVGRLKNAAVEVTVADLEKAVAACAESVAIQPSLTPVVSVNPTRPIWVKWLASRRQPGEVGAGDTLERFLRAFAADRAAKLWERFAGKSCGCQDRKSWLNRTYPY